MATAKLNDALQMEVRNESACRREYSFKLAADALKVECDRVACGIAGMVQLPGFRAGKAPQHLVRTKYAAEINEELRNRIVGAAIAKVEDDKTIDVVGVTFKKAPEIVSGKDVELSFNVDIAPEIDLGDYKAIKLDLPEESVSEEKIDERIESYRTMWGGYADSDAPAQSGDMLKVSYKSDFAVAEDASPAVKRQAEASDTFLWLSEPEMIPGSIKALTGAEKGKEYSFDAEYPADYREAALAGKKVRYTVTVSAIQSRTKLNDEELVARVKAPSMEEFRKTLAQAMEQENKSKRLEAAQQAFFEKLDAAVGDFEFPPSLLDGETARELQKMMQNLRTEKDAEAFKEKIEENRKSASEAAKKTLRRSLILRR
ncbi:MAG: trigger factor, partial [Victivallaceae bacterium]|nr:trigger factor [Victivallaceae bacterium]